MQQLHQAGVLIGHATSGTACLMRCFSHPMRRSASEDTSGGRSSDSRTKLFTEGAAGAAPAIGAFITGGSTDTSSRKPICAGGLQPGNDDGAPRRATTRQ